MPNYRRICVQPSNGLFTLKKRGGNIHRASDASQNQEIENIYEDEARRSEMRRRDLSAMHHRGESKLDSARSTKHKKK